MDCQDCGKKQADTVIFSMEHLTHIAVCRDCIGSGEYKDYICPESWIDWDYLNEED